MSTSKSVSATVLRRQKADPTSPTPSLNTSPAPCCQAYVAEIKRRRKERFAAKAKQRAEKLLSKSCGRLPDGSKFDVSYDATAQTWSGALVTTINGHPARFAASACAVFKLLAKLDGLYRAAMVCDAALSRSEP